MRRNKSHGVSRSFRDQVGNRGRGRPFNWKTLALATTLVTMTGGALGAVSTSIGIWPTLPEWPTTKISCAKADARLVKVVLVDRTDEKFTLPYQRRILEDKLLITTPLSFDEGTHVVVAELQSSSYEPYRIVWQKCSPGRSGSASVISRTPSRVEAKFQEAFWPGYRDAIQSVLQPIKDPEQTPLIEGINGIYADVRHTYGTTAGIEITVVTDMLQHVVNGPSTYVGDGSARALLGNGSAHPSIPRSQMTNSQVSFLMIKRPGLKSASRIDMEKQQRRMMALMPEFYGTLTGQPVSVDPV